MSNLKEIHLVSFDNPYPPHYGGVIDVYYKVKALACLGVVIHLHCYVKKTPENIDELKRVCKTVSFYFQKKTVFKMFSIKPFSVISRHDKNLAKNINKTKAPVLFDGLQTTSILSYLKLDKNRIFLRLHNNEAAYYYGLYNSEKNLIKKFLFLIESKKYKNYQTVNFLKFQKIFTLSIKESQFVNEIAKNAIYVPVFHGNKLIKPIAGKGHFALYQGDLKTSDNRAVVKWLISIFKKNPKYKLVIAAGPKGKFVERLIAEYQNINYIQINKYNDLVNLFENAHCNLVFSFQESGTKLKLINALYNSRYCIINKNVTDDKVVKSMCYIVEDEKSLLILLEKIYNLPYGIDITKKTKIENLLSDKRNANIILKSIFKNSK